MSFLFPNFAAPPPDVPDYISIRRQASSKIQNFLSSNHIQATSTEETWTIAKFHGKLAEIAQLKEQIQLFRQDFDAAKIPEIELLKAKLSTLLKEINSDSVLNQMKQKINRRQIKRANLKRKKQKKVETIQKVLKERELKSKKIDENIRQIQSKIAEEKAVNEGKAEIEKILSEAKRKIENAKQQLELCDHLTELRRLRKAQAGTSTDDFSLEASIQNLRSLWRGALAKYQQVHKDMEAYLLEELNRSQFVEDQWNEVLFGEKWLKTEISWKDLVAIRRAWDACLDTEGTPIPSFWVLPNESPSEGWSKYLL